MSYEITWLESLLKELFIPLPKVSITWCDNLSTSQLTNNPVSHAITKHIEVDVHFIIDKILNRKIEVRYTPSQDQIADCLIKAQGEIQFYKSRNKLGLVEKPLPLPSLKGNVKKYETNNQGNIIRCVSVPALATCISQITAYHELHNDKNKLYCLP